MVPADATALSMAGWDTADALVGRSANFVSEKISTLFLRTVKILGIQGKRAKVSPDHLPHDVEVDVDDLDLLPQMVANPPAKRGILSKIELEEAHLRFKDELPEMTIADKLTDRHIMLGHWVIQRDLPGAKGHYLVPPQIVWTFHKAAVDGEAGPELREKAADVMKKRFSRSGLLGVPICEADHWTLLCFRKSATGVQIKYYDSLKNVQADCWRVAKMIVQMLDPELEMPSDKSNASVQSNGVDCGVYLLHYWEMEIRRFEGYGWVGQWPQNNKQIKSRKERLINFQKQIKSYEPPPPPKKKKKKKKDIVVIDLPPPIEDERARIVTRAQIKLDALAKAAEKAADQGSVMFYGCSRCRYIRTGCISHKCHPEKFLAHYAKFPEKYTKGTKMLSQEAFAKLGIPELVGWANKDKEILVGGGATQGILTLC